MKNRRLIAGLLVLCCLAGVLSACGAGKKTDGAIRIVATIFPIYDWAREILGEHSDRAKLTLLLDSGVDLHSFQPSVQDVARVSACDLFLYAGGESDHWVAAALAKKQNRDLSALNFLEILGDRAKAEEEKEGMEAGEEEEEEEEEEKDEHLWLSLKCAAVCVRAICEEICRLDPDFAGDYRKNGEEYLARLAALDAEYEKAVAAAPKKTLVFGDRFPFRYLTDDYGLDYYAAFKGCAAESEASFRTVIFLAGKVDELGLGSIMQIETSDGSLARTVRENTAGKDQEILTLVSFQGMPGEGETYLSVMQNNLAVLKDALK